MSEQQLSQPRFKGGQCLGVLYNINGTFTEIVGSRSDFEYAKTVTWTFNNAQFGYGPILKLNTQVGDTYGGHFFGSIAGENSETINNPNSHIGAYTDIKDPPDVDTNQYWCKVTAINISFTRADGQPDNCGGPPTTEAPNANPYNTQPDNNCCIANAPF